jgi:lipopolysaccharide/colanic/teichoic acid biosynthesis glycosyltransferase/glycosyltransferase involved in cell wall biosynthesis
MKVLHLGKFYPPARGGMETILELICDRTSGRVNNKVLVANVGWATSEERCRDVDVVRLPAISKIGAVAVCPTMPFRLAREAANANLIVLHEPNPMALLAYFLARPAGTLIVWFHSEVVRPSWRYRLFYRPFLQFALTRAARIVVASPTLAASSPQLQEWRSKCVVIPYGATHRIPASEASARRADAIRREHQRPIVLFVGRLVAYKGVDVLLDAMRGVSAVAALVGDGQLRASLQQKAETLGIANRVAFLGEVEDDELAALYQACDVFVLPSVTRQEAFGVVQVEAMTYGKPVISTDLGTGVAWVNQHGTTGLVVPPSDPLALRDALNRLLADPTTRDVMGAAGARRAKSVFSVDRMIELTLDLYRDALGAVSPDPDGRKQVAVPGMSGAKRSLDLLLSGTGLITSAPLWAMIAALIKLQDGGPVFFSQERVGRHGQTFRALKFRSMTVDAEALTGPIQSGEHDPRVTRFGQFLRATAMDELPQLWNIFRGDMSFVGPRALRPGEIDVNGQGKLEHLEDVPGFRERTAVVPGLTGVAQIYADRDVVRRHKFRYDKLYIRRQSFWLDVRLIALSFWITFRGTWENRGGKL